MVRLHQEDIRDLIAVLLLVFIGVTAVFLWSLDLLTQQDSFGILLSAALVAFSMLVYIYRMEKPRDINKGWLFAGFCAMTLLLLLTIVSR